MLKSIVKKTKDSHEEKKHQEVVNIRAEIKRIYKDFLNGEGRLPEGFSERYNIIPPNGFIIRNTPFETYIKKS